MSTNTSPSQFGLPGKDNQTPPLADGPSAEATANFVLCDGIYRSSKPVEHREDEYPSGGFEVLAAMQERHFWYRGRHRFLLAAVGRFLRETKSLRAIDLGGGCGGWLNYLQKKRQFAELAMADSSLEALRRTGRLLPSNIRRYQLDLLDISQSDYWDAAFLLDVLEHIPADEDALRQIRRALKPDGLLFVTVPALRFFWSWIDKIGGHQRRYGKADFHRLAAHCGFRVVSLRYFMFFLSPLYVASRFFEPPLDRLSTEEIRKRAHAAHQVPARPINALLTAAFACESPIGNWLPFPWGTSLLAVLQKCDDRVQTRAA